MIIFMGIDSLKDNKNSDHVFTHIGNRPGTGRMIYRVRWNSRVTIRCGPVAKQPLGYGLVQFKELTTIKAEVSLDRPHLRWKPRHVRPRRKTCHDMPKAGWNRPTFIKLCSFFQCLFNCSAVNLGATSMSIISYFDEPVFVIENAPCCIDFHCRHENKFRQIEGGA